MSEAQTALKSVPIMGRSSKRGGIVSAAGGLISAEQGVVISAQHCEDLGQIGHDASDAAPE